MDNMDTIVQQILAQMNANAKANQEESRKANQELMAKMDSNQKKAEADKEEMLARIKEDRKADQEMAMLEAQQKRMMACLGQTEANTEKIDPGMMQSIEEHQDVPNEDVAMMPVGEPRK
jgi:hypothetical protein